MVNGWKLGEKEFLKVLHKKLGNIGHDWRDDCIERKIAPDLSLVYSIDSMSRWLSHNRADDAKAYGKWAAAIIANDVIACGVSPKGLSLDIGINIFEDEEEVFKFIDGVLEVCSHYNMKYEGGNMSKSNYVCGMSWGVSAPDAIIHRDGAKNNSILLATASIGLGWAAELVQRIESLKQADFPMKLQKILECYKETPTINLEAFQEIWSHNLIECGMDLSDGIIEFGYEIFERTGLGVVFNPQPPHKAVEFVASLMNIEPQDIMFDPGYDTPFSHGWCIKRENINELLKILEKYKVAYTILGDVNDKVSGVYRKYGNNLVKLPRYWDDKMQHESSYHLWLRNILNCDQKSW